MSQPPRAPLTLELSGGRPPAPFTLGLGGALLIAVLVHLAAIWLLARLPAISSLSPRRVSPLQVEFQEPREPRPERPRRQPRPQAKPRPFKFVDIPDEPEVNNPHAPALSDRSRRARAPLRPDASHKTDNPDPYALGNTPQNVLLAPAPKPPAAAEVGGPGSPPAPAAAAGGPLPGSRGSAEKRGDVAFKQARAGSGGGKDSATESAHGPGAGGGQRRPGAPGGLLSQVPRVSEGELLESFHNPGGTALSQIGSVSFDTAAIDWGPYAREMLRVIRRNWIERYPPAAASGLMGVVIVNFRIARDGGVSAVTLVDSYGVRLSPSGRVEIIPGIRPLEASALEAIQVSELPPLPDIFSESDVGVSLGFYYNVPPPPR
jgi:outer membrane biosynthesis protein TonB